MNLWPNFKKILKNSVITGVPQIVATKNNFRKILKTYVFFVCVTGFFWQTFTFLSVYWTYPTVVDVQYYFPDDFDLPAVTFCSSNGIKSSMFCQRFSHLCYPNSSLEEFCTNHLLLCDPNNNFPENVSFPTVAARELPLLSRREYQKMGLQPQEMVTGCVVYESPRVTDCTLSYEVVNVFDTKGLPTNCYSYNSLWGKVEGARQIKTKTVLLFTMKSERYQTNQFYTGTPYAIQVAIHSPYMLINPFMNGFSIKPCSNYYIFPTMLCSEECYLNKSLEKAGCVDPFFVTYPNMERICKEEAHFSIYDECRNQCRPACEREDFSADVQEHAFLRSKPRGKEKGNECVSTIMISFNRMEIVQYTYSPKYESVSLFSYVGGYLGLWLGISLVAICDAIETLLLLLQWLWEKIRRHIKNRRLVNVKPNRKTNNVQGQLFIL
ncbi:hypothetical protein JTE90_007504 [Oedothorax gibbosus]|uniref:Uncharacterized protein n=1 Tax=Oedothorax gibbosus TaxID=931172 RepID=A0AAV6VN71_9ARAC|nr:hypothetical protein JTE90_007504 [Oedothorax gibbosus]